MREKSWIKNRTVQLVDDLNAVRAAILGKEAMNPAEHARLEPRLFESWVIEKLAQIEALAMSSREQLDETQDEMSDLQAEVKALQAEAKALRKELGRVGKKK
jgi:hypothetical protein